MKELQERVARAFSGHRFAEAYPHLADDVLWVTPGGGARVGRQAVVAACDELAAELEGVEHAFSRFLVVVGEDAVVVDSLAEYLDPSGDRTAVASCDVYEFTGDVVRRITTYAADATE